MTILQAHKHYFRRDGASNYTISLSDALTASGETVVPFAMSHPSNLATPYAKFFVPYVDLANPGNVSIVQKIRTAMRMVYYPTARHQLEALLSATPIDVAHIHNIYHQISPSILLTLRKHKIPVVMTVHDYKLLCPNYTMFHHGAVHEEDSRGWYTSCVRGKCMNNSYAESALVTGEMIVHHKVFRWYERYVDRFIAPSRFVYDQLVSHGWDVNRIVHIPHPVDVPPTKGEVKDHGYVLYAGRLSPEKGVDVLLRAAARTPEIPYRIVGDGDDRERLLALAKTVNLRNVVFAGFQTGDALQKSMADASIVVIPSVWQELYSLSILEGKAAGKVVIGTRLGGMTEMLPDELLVSPHDDAGLARVIARWYAKDPASRVRVGESLRREVMRENDPSEHLRRVKEVYQSLL